MSHGNFASHSRGHRRRDSHYGGGGGGYVHPRSHRGGGGRHQNGRGYGDSRPYPVAEAANEEAKAALVLALQTLAANVHRSTASEPSAAFASLFEAPYTTPALAYLGCRYFERLRCEPNPEEHPSLVAAKATLGQLIHGLRRLLTHRLTVTTLHQGNICLLVDEEVATQLGALEVLGPHSRDLRLPLSILHDLMAHAHYFRRMRLMEPQWECQLEVLRLMIKSAVDRNAIPHELAKIFFADQRRDGCLNKSCIRHGDSVPAYLYYECPAPTSQESFAEETRAAKVNHEVVGTLISILRQVIKGMGEDSEEEGRWALTVPEDPTQTPTEDPKHAVPKTIIRLHRLEDLSPSELAAKLPPGLQDSLAAVVGRMEEGQILWEDTDIGLGLAPLILADRALTERFLKLAPAAVAMTDLRAGKAYLELLRALYDAAPPELAARLDFARRFREANPARYACLSKAVSNNDWTGVVSGLMGRLEGPLEPTTHWLRPLCTELIWLSLLSPPDGLHRLLCRVVEVPAAVPRLLRALAEVPQVGQLRPTSGVITNGLRALGKIGNHISETSTDPSAFLELAVGLATPPKAQQKEKDGVNEELKPETEEKKEDKEEEEKEEKEEEKDADKDGEKETVMEKEEEEKPKEAKDAAGKSESSAEVFVTAQALAQSYAAMELHRQGPAQGVIHLELLGRLASQLPHQLRLYVGAPAKGLLPAPQPERAKTRYSDKIGLILQELIDKVVTELSAEEAAAAEAAVSEVEGPPSDCLCLAELIYHAARAAEDRGRGCEDRATKAGVTALAGLAAAAAAQGLRLTAKAGAWLRLALARHRITFPAQPLVALALAQIWPEEEAEALPNFVVPKIPAAVAALLPAKRRKQFQILPESQSSAGGGCGLRSLLRLFSLAPSAVVEMIRAEEGSSGGGSGLAPEVLEEELTELMATSPAFATPEGWLQFIRLRRLARGEQSQDQVIPCGAELSELGEALVRLLLACRVSGERRHGNWRPAQIVHREGGPSLDHATLNGLAITFTSLAQRWFVTFRPSGSLVERLCTDKEVARLELLLHHVGVVSADFQRRVSPGHGSAEAPHAVTAALGQMGAFRERLAVRLKLAEPKETAAAGHAQHLVAGGQNEPQQQRYQTPPSPQQRVAAQRLPPPKPLLSPPPQPPPKSPEPPAAAKPVELPPPPQAPAPKPRVEERATKKDSRPPKPRPREAAETKAEEETEQSRATVEKEPAKTAPAKAKKNRNKAKGKPRGEKNGAGDGGGEAETGESGRSTPQGPHSLQSIAASLTDPTRGNHPPSDSHRGHRQSEAGRVHRQPTEAKAQPQTLAAATGVYIPSHNRLADPVGKGAFYENHKGRFEAQVASAFPSELGYQQQRAQFGGLGQGSGVSLQSNFDMQSSISGAAANFKPRREADEAEVKSASYRHLGGYHGGHSHVAKSEMGMGVTEMPLPPPDLSQPPPPSRKPQRSGGHRYSNQQRSGSDRSSYPGGSSYRGRSGQIQGSSGYMGINHIQEYHAELLPQQPPPPQHPPPQIHDQSQYPSLASATSGARGHSHSWRQPQPQSGAPIPPQYANHYSPTN